MISTLLLVIALILTIINGLNKNCPLWIPVLITIIALLAPALPFLR